MRHVTACFAVLVILGGFYAHAASPDLNVSSGSFMQEGTPTRFSCFITATNSTTQCQVTPGAGLRNYVTSVTFSNQVATVQTLDIVQGTGTNCATGIAALTHKFQMGTNSLTTSPFLASATFDTPLVPIAGNAICVRPTASTNYGATITGYVGP